MTSLEITDMVAEYSAKFPNMPRENHEKIIGAALQPNASFTVEGFRNWYDDVAPYLSNHPEVLRELLESPRFMIYRESMILGGDWAGTSILRRVRPAA